MKTHFKIQIFLFAIIVCFFSSKLKAFNCSRKGCVIQTAQVETKTENPSKNQLDEILAKLREQNRKLNSYEANLEYLFIQDPELIDSRTTRKGKIYYQKDGAGSKLKIRFDKRKEDDEPEQNRLEEYYFDGVWLTIIDHLNKTINSYQKAPVDKPVDAFELISRDFPIVGFTSKDDLRKNFEITLVEDDKETDDKDQTTRLKLKVKKGSPYEKRYTEIDFFIDNKTFLPVKMITKSIEGDIYDFKFSDAKINKKIKESVFKLEKPANFSENAYPLKKKRSEEKNKNG